MGPESPPLRPSYLLEVLRPVARRLMGEKTQKLSRLNDGHFLERCLTLSSETTNPVSRDPWATIRERINTVFGEDLIDWSEASKAPKTSSRDSVTSLTSLTAALEEAHLSNTDLMVLSLLVLFTSSVHDQMSPMFEIMTSKEVTPRVQAIIERAFKTLLDNRTVLTRNIVLKVLSEFSPDSSSHSSDTSPSSSFTYSPKTTSTPKTPLQKFRSPETTQVIKFQKIAQEQARCLRQTRVELDQEKAESEYLKQEVERLKKDRDGVRRCLEETRESLAAKADPVSPHEIEQLRKTNMDLQRKVIDRKDEEKYYKGIEAKYETLSDAHRELKAKMATQKDKLNETSNARAILQSQAVEFRSRAQAAEEEKRSLEEMVEELKAQVKEMQEMRRPDPMMDISVDDPRPVCLSPPKTVDSAGHEVIGQTVILELQTQIGRLQDELDAKSNEVERVNGHVQVLNGQLSESAKMFDDQQADYSNRFQKQEEKIATLTARSEDLSAQNADAERKISSLQKNYQLSHQTYLNEKQVSDEKTQQLMDLNAKLKEAKTEIKSKADFIQGLEQQMVKLQNDKDTMAETNLREKTHLSEKVASLEGLVKEKTSSVKQLEDTMREQADSYRQQVESLKARCDSQVSLTSELKSDKENLQSELQHSQSKLAIATEVLEAKKTELTHINQEMIEQTTRFQQETETFKKTEADNSATINQLTTKLSSAQSEVEEYVVAVQKLEEENRAKSEAIATESKSHSTAIENIKLDNASYIEKVNNDHEETLKKAQSVYNSKLERLKGDLEAAKTKYSGEFEALEAQLVKVNADLKSSQDERSQLEKKASEKVLQMETELMQARDDLVSLAATKDLEKQELSDALSKAQLEIEKATEMTDDMKAQRVTETKENQEFVESLKKDLESAQEREDTMRQDLRRTKDLLTSKETELQNKICELKQSSDAKIEELSINSNEISKTVATLKQKEEDLTARIKIANQEISSLKDIQNHLQAKHLKETKENHQLVENLTKDLASAHEEGVKTRQDLHVTQELLATRENEFKSKMSDLEKNSDARIEELSRAVAAEQAKQKSILEAADQESVKLQEAKKEISSLKAIKEETAKANGEMLKEIENIKAEHLQLQQHQEFSVKTLTEQLELVLKEKEEIEESKAALVKKAAETQLEMETQTAKMSELEEASKTTDSQAVVLESKVGELGKLCDHKEEIIESLSRELESLREEGETLKKREAVMVAENNSNCQTIQRLNDQLLSISQGHISKAEASNNQITLLQSQLAQMTDKVEELTRAKRSWDSAKDEAKRDLAETKETLDTRTEECKNLMVSVTDLQQFLRREKDSAIELQKKDTDSQKLLEEQGQVRAELEERIKYLEGREADSSKEAEAKLKEEKEAALKEQKTRYEGRVKEIADQVKSQYQKRISDCQVLVNKYKADIESKNDEIQKLKLHVNASSDFEDKYSMAKEKLSELAEAVEEASKQKAEVEEKYSTSKEAIRNLQADLKQAQVGGVLKQKNEALQRELNAARNELRSLKVQNMAADTKIRMLQSEQHKSEHGGGGHVSRRQTLAPGGATMAARETTSRVVKYSSTDDQVRMTRAKSTTDEDVFKMPCVGKHTPGRARAGRTQSEASMPRRPPLGSGSFFQADDEDGEMFSNSYLTDLKDGRCNADPSRLSELARRNTMVLPHLKSSYPAETQFYKKDEFKDRDLQQGTLEDVSLITDKTAEISFDSPAMNTRRSRQSVKPAIAFNIEASTPPSHPEEKKEVARKVKAPVAFTVGRGGTDEHNVTDENTRPSRIPRKRRSTTTPAELQRHNLDNSNASDTSLNKSTASTHSSGSKRTRREQNMVSYSKPGPPTPARTKPGPNRSINTSDTSLSNVSIDSQSMVTPSNKAFRPSRKVTEKTPLLETTNQSTKSITSSVNRTAGNRSLRSLGKTPMSLKKIMTKTFRKKTMYDVKTGLKRTGLSPKKKLKI